MKHFFFLVPTILLLQQTAVLAQAPSSPAAESIQQSQDKAVAVQQAVATQQAVLSQAGSGDPINLPAGTALDVEAAHTSSSGEVQVGELLSFRVLIPVTIDSHIVIEKGALVTARVVEAKRAGHWGRAGSFSWVMEDVIAADGTRIPVRPEANKIRDESRQLKPDRKGVTRTNNSNSVKGMGHGGEIATKAIIAGAIFPPLAPLGLIQGFRRGENAILSEGKRFVVFVREDATVRVNTSR